LDWIYFIIFPWKIRMRWRKYYQHFIG